MIETESATWQAVKAWAEKEIKEALEMLAEAGLGPIQTEFERGRLRTARSALALAEGRRAAPVNDGVSYN